MRHRSLLIAILLASATLPARAQQPDTVAAPADSVAPADTAAAADMTARTPLRWRLGLKPIAPPFEIRLPPAPGADALWLRPRSTAWAREWVRETRADLELRRSRVWRDRWRAEPGAAPDSVAYLPPEPEPDTSAADADVLPGVAGEYADLGLSVNGRAEMGGAWSQFRPCDPTGLVNCDPGLFPQLRPDVQFGVRVGGTVADRVHINVDYDQRREFDAANNINVYYQGLEDEILQRLEVGDVSIALPQSRYLTRGIPAGNFGFKATGQVGPMDFQAVWAQQKGDVSTREFRLGGAGDSEGLVQEQQVPLDDTDYVTGQFFFLVHPDSLAGSPYVDALRLNAGDAPASIRPSADALQVYRTERVNRYNPDLGYFLGNAVTADGLQEHSGQFRRLRLEEDFRVHKSGLWIVLRTPLQAYEALAVAYRTEAGDTVGTLNADNAAENADRTPTLRLLRGPLTSHSPNRSTWRYEMHNVYRVDSSDDVEPTSVQLEISLGGQAGGITARDVAGRQIPFLQLFGLDEDPPTQQIDRAHIYQPGRSDFEAGGGVGVGGTYIVFPSLEPFAAPVPGGRAGLTEEAIQQALGPDANTAIYREEDPVVRESSSRFRLNLEYRVRMRGLVSSFNLGALGIREGSEKIFVDGQPLEQGTDYTIDYDVGMVTLSNPQELFATNPDAEIRATYEQKAQFQISPTSVFGMNTHYALGERGELNFVGLYQQEKSIMSRPQLGIEPGSIFLGGASGRLELGGGWLDRTLDALPGLQSTGTSSVDLTGELAMSAPNPNTRGETYLDDFEGGNEIRISLSTRSWYLGSRPQALDGAADVLPPVLNTATAASLVWQHKYLDPEGNPAGGLFPHRIDEQFETAGQPVRERVLYLAFGDESDEPGARRWRSVTTVLSTTGRDMTRSEYLEFYAYAPDEQDFTLIFDIGTVSEDAYYFDADGGLTGTYPDGTPWGLGTLDEEARLVDNEAWGPERDARGLWNQDCTGDPAATYELGDPQANCTVDNGLPDTEDLSGNGVLDNNGNDGPYFRYVVPLDELSRYLVRDTLGTGTPFRLYRVPLRVLDALAVNGAHAGTWRFIQHLRMTVAGRPAQSTGLAIARMRVVGSRWTKRDVHGILRGATGRGAGAGSATASLRVGPVSEITDGDVYSSPPGVRSQLQDPTQNFGVGATQFNEKSIRLEYEDLQPDERGETYYRYPQDPRNFLSYRQLRLWAVPRAGDWGEQGDHRLMVKVGTDAGNYYIYRTPLSPAADGARVRPEDWRELVIDFEHWFELKARAEQALIERDSAAAGERVELWSEDSTYAVVMEDRARAPNLSGVREISFAVYNGGGMAADGEVWINDMRLGRAVTDAGYAGRVDLDVRAGDFVSANVSVANRSALFRQLNQDATYLTTGTMNVSGTAQLGQLAPTSWDIAMPLSVTHSRSLDTPTFLDRSDVLASELDGLRETGQESTRIGVSIRKRTPTANPWLSLLIDGVSLRLGYNTATNASVTTRSESEGVNGSLGYDRQIPARDFDLTPGFVETVLGWLLPEPLEQSRLFERLTDARLRWTPENIGFSTSYNAREARSFRYGRILTTPADSAVEPITSPRRGLENSARIAFRPLESLTANVSVSSSRDVLSAEQATRRTDAQAAIRAARSALAGTDIGWETDRRVSSQLQFRPNVAGWLRPTFTYSGNFNMDRSPSYLEEVVRGGDTITVLQRNARANRQLSRSLLLEPTGLLQSTLGPAPPSDHFLYRALYAMSRAVQPVRLNWTDGLNSRFERETLDPAVGYQLALGGLDRFRYMDGDTAAEASTRSSFQAQSGLNLPWSISVDVGYSHRRARGRDLRGGERSSDEHGWPNLQLSWGSIPIPSVLESVFARASASTGYRVNRNESVISSGGDRQGRNQTVPLQLSLSLTNGMSATYNANMTRGSQHHPSGDKRRTSTNQNVQLRGTFDAPGPLSDQFPEPIQATASYRYGAQYECRLEEDLECVPRVDTVNRQFDLTLDTRLSDLNVGLQMSYVDRQDYIGRQRGSSNFRLRVFGNFNFSAGRFPTGGRR